MKEHCRAFSAEESMRHVGDIVTVGISNGEDTWNVRRQALGIICCELSSIELHACILSDLGLLLRGEVREEGISENSVAISELNLEQVMLRMRGQARVCEWRGTISKACD